MCASLGSYRFNKHIWHHVCWIKLTKKLSEKILSNLLRSFISLFLLLLIFLTLLLRSFHLFPKEFNSLRIKYKTQNQLFTIHDLVFPRVSFSIPFSFHRILLSFRRVAFFSSSVARIPPWFGRVFGQCSQFALQIGDLYHLLNI